MQRLGVAAFVCAAVLAVVSCGGGYSGGGTPSPSPVTGGSTSAVTITIRGINGKLSFTPNPASVPSGTMVVFMNADTTPHHVILDDGSLQTADIAPGATSAPLALGGINKAYHCTIHPTMVGSLNAADTPDPPPCTFNYC
jgi:plastocyanin